MVHHKDKKATADFLDTAAGCMAVDKEDVVLASADFVAGGDCADFAKTVHTAAHFDMAAVPDMVNDMYDLLVAAVADTAQLFADAAHFEKILLPRLPVPLSSPLPHLQELLVVQSLYFLFVSEFALFFALLYFHLKNLDSYDNLLSR